jgi:hypothetical protein
MVSQADTKGVQIRNTIHRVMRGHCCDCWQPHDTGDMGVVNITHSENLT